jgi:formylmethanofuran dehydrogenase subunit E
MSNRFAYICESCRVSLSRNAIAVIGSRIFCQTCAEKESK